MNPIVNQCCNLNTNNANDEMLMPSNPIITNNYPI